MFSIGRFTMFKVLALLLTSQLPQTRRAYKGNWMRNVGSMVDIAGHFSGIFLHSLPHGLVESLTSPRGLFLFAGDKFRNAGHSHPLPDTVILSEVSIRHERNSRRGFWEVVLTL